MIKAYSSFFITLSIAEILIKPQLSIISTAEKYYQLM